MDPTGLIIAALVLGVAAAFGLWRRATDGRVRQVSGGAAQVEIPGDDRPEAALVVQFSSELCAPCRGVRRVIGEVLGGRADVASVELDVAEHPTLAQHFNVLRTPTVLVLDADRQARFRASGPLTRPALLEAIEQLPRIPQESR